MANVNQINMEFIQKTVESIERVNSGGVLDISMVKDDFKRNANLWNNVTIKLMDLYVKLYNSIEVIDEVNRIDLTKNIIETLNSLVNTSNYKYFEESTIEIFNCVKEDIKIAVNFGMITQDEYNDLFEWAENEIKEISLVKENPLEHFRYVNLEFSYHNHYMRLDGVHSNGLTNDIFINKILDKIYENDTNCAQITKVLLDTNGYYNRRVANILSAGTIIELYLEFDNPDGAGSVRFIRSGGENECSLCFNKQEGFDVSPESELKDPVIERCMNELFNIINIIQNL